MVKLVCYNIEYCEGIEGKWYQYLQFWKIFLPPKNLDQKIVNELNKIKPDILALVEVDTGSFRAKKDEVIFFEKKLGMKSFVEKIKYPFKSWMKLFHYVPILRKQANAIISKFNLDNVKYHLFHEGTKRVIIEASLKCPKKITLLVAHLALGKKTRDAQIKELIKIVNKIKNPVILMGDFNTFAGEEEIKILLEKTHLQHHKELETGNGFTQPTFKPTRRLDYVLTSQKIKVNKYQVLNYQFSDHKPLLVEFIVK